jgi:MATE family multidrug resistance protein
VESIIKNQPEPLGTGRLGEVLRIAFPLVMSSGTFAFKLFCDRLMLAWYSETAISAALSAGMTCFMLVSFFMGVAQYANAFVAQYTGAGRHDRVGLAVWQTVFFSLAAGALMVLAGRLFSPIFSRIGHSHLLALEEEGYFLVLTAGAVFALLTTGLMCFWTGRGKTWTVVGVGFASIFLNVAMNWALIFGAEGSPHLAGAPWPLSAIGNQLNALGAWIGSDRLGTIGAGLATAGTDAISVLAFLVLFLRRENRRRYGAWPKRLFDYALTRRMLRFGFGNGMQLFLDIASFAVFNLLIGMYGPTSGGGHVGAASGIAISIHAAAFIPMLGLGAAASILVGQGIGARDIPFAVRSVRSARIIIMSYMAFVCLFYTLKPELVVSLFAPGGSMNVETRSLAADFVRLAGLFGLADAFFILYGNAIRGAGDTRFSMYVMGICGWFLFAIPCLIAYGLGAGPYFLWWILVFYAAVSAAIFYWRYRRGDWKRMRVIEDGGASRRLSASSARLVPPGLGDPAVLPPDGPETSLKRSVEDGS